MKLKTIFSVVMASAVSTMAFAQSFTLDGLSYTIGGDTAVVKAATKTAENVVIPETVEYNDGEKTATYTVKGIAASGFFGYRAMKSISLPSTLTDIGRAAFWNCSGLETVSLPENIKAIGPSIFTGCSSLRKLTVGKDLNYIEPASFMNCTKLDSIIIPEENKYFYAVGGTVYSKDGETLLNHAGSDTAFVIPDGVKTIAKDAFWYCKILKSVTIPASVTTIDEYAFYSCGLTTLSIPATVDSIGEYAFQGCRELDSIFVYWETPISITQTVFMGGTNKRVLFVPEGTLDTYKATFPWSAFINIAEQTTAIWSPTVNPDAFRVETNGTTITVTSKSESGMLEIINISGECVYTAPIAKGAALTLPSVLPGIYLVKLNGQSAKVLVR